MIGSWLVVFLLQFRDNKWVSWEELGTEELYGHAYHKIDQKVATDVSNSFQSKQIKAITINRTELADMERRLIDPAVQAFSNWSISGRMNE